MPGLPCRGQSPGTGSMTIRIFMVTLQDPGPFPQRNETGGVPIGIEKREGERLLETRRWQ